MIPISDITFICGNKVFLFTGLISYQNVSNDASEHILPGFCLYKGPDLSDQRS